MARPVTNKVMEDRVWARQRNGTWYCYERRRQWRGGKTVELERRLIGKADERGGELRPTRPKRPPRGRAASSGGGVTATRKHTGMCDILEFIGTDSGIDEDLRAVTDAGTADKLTSLARYLVGTNGATFPGVEEWQLTHTVPYEPGITEDVYGDLFREVGADESIAQGFFARRLAREEDPFLYIAYDSTTIDADTDDPAARDGMSKSHTGSRTVKLLVLYSMASRRPLAYAKQPGNVPDQISLENAIKQLKALGAKKFAIVSDAGFATERNIGAALHAGEHILTKVKIGWKWVSEQVDAHLEELGRPMSIMPCDTTTKGVTVALTREFPFTRTYASKAKGLEAGDTDHVRRRVYLHIYFDTTRKEKEDLAFWKRLTDVMRLVEGGATLDEADAKVRDKYLDVRERAGKVTVRMREDAIEDACRLHGVFALVSDKFKDTNQALGVYRKREWIEDYYERHKNDAGGSTARTGSPESLNGRLFTQFLAMCYIEDLHCRIRAMEGELGVPNGDPEHDRKESLDKELKLKRWLDKRSLHRTLKWFDAHEEIEVSNGITRKKWSTEVVARDRLFLEKLGLPKGKV